MSHSGLALALKGVAILAVASLSPAPAGAQESNPPPALEIFVGEVIELWTAGDAISLIDLVSPENRLTLDTGSGIENVNVRHAVAALRALFAERETLETRPVRVSVASTGPARGFAELSWNFRVRGAPGEDSSSVYVGATWQEDLWRITELRLMP